MERILRVDLTDSKYWVEELADNLVDEYVGGRGTTIDPISESALIAKGGIDCTEPDDGSFPKRNMIPPEVYEAINLEEFFPGDALSRVPIEST